MSFKYTKDCDCPWFITRYDRASATFERFDYRVCSWVEDLDLTKILVGDYCEFDEITEGAARTLISRFAEERPWEHRN